MVLAAVGVGSGSSAGSTRGGGRSLNALGATLIFLFTFPVPISVLSESFQITAAGGPLNLRVHQPFRRTLIHRHRQTDTHTNKDKTETHKHKHTGGAEAKWPDADGMATRAAGLQWM